MRFSFFFRSNFSFSEGCEKLREKCEFYSVCLSDGKGSGRCECPTECPFNTTALDDEKVIKRKTNGYFFLSVFILLLEWSRLWNGWCHLFFRMSSQTKRLSKKKICCGGLFWKMRYFSEYLIVYRFLSILSHPVHLINSI